MGARGAAEVAAFAVFAVNLVAGAWGGWQWWRVTTSRGAWVAIRVAQAAAAAFAIVAGVLYATGMRPHDDLFWLYVLLPVAVGFVAEQLRALSAETVLEARGLPDAQAMRALDEAAQQSIVTAIVRRELGIMALACLVTCFLALRAHGTV